MSRQAEMGTEPTARQSVPGWDALLIALLLFCLLMINGFAEGSLGGRFQDVARHPWLGQLLPATGVAAMGEIGPRPAEPLALVLYATLLGLLILYCWIDVGLTGRLQQVGKWVVLIGMILGAIYLPTAKLMLLDAQGPRGSYSHDGGVLQTEATIAFLLAGKNPYVEDYTATPMATWGHPDFRTALYHYPYLPWTFVFSAPFYLIGQLVGFYDQRIVYLVLLAVALGASASLVRDQRGKLALVAALALNPLMALDLLFGQNDSFVLCWLLFALAAWQGWFSRVAAGADQGPSQLEQRARRWRLLSVICFGLACASKPTAWFFAPFYGLLLLADQPQLRTGRWGERLRLSGLLLRRSWPALLVFGLLIGPYLLWDAFAFYDDVWRWSNGQGEHGYQIWGWGASNFVLAFGGLTNRFAQWPFWQLEVILALPTLLWFLYRQLRVNTLSNACWHYGVFLLIFFYGSRFLNENYLGYILAVLCVAIIPLYSRVLTSGVGEE